MSDKKIIIRNCPAFVLMRTATSGTYFNICGTAKGHVECKDCTDCVMKQIYKLCKDDYTQFGDKELRYDTLEEIIKLLDIQEVE